MARLDGFDANLFERVIRGMTDQQQEAARKIAESSRGDHGELAYAEATTVEGKQRKYNFTSADGETCWLAIHGTNNTLSMDVRDGGRMIKDTSWYTVSENGEQFSKGRWRRLTLKSPSPNEVQIGELVALLYRVHEELVS